jgi:hypothetical protein
LNQITGGTKWVPSRASKEKSFNPLDRGNLNQIAKRASDKRSKPANLGGEFVSIP